jgi:hypothetical protein
MPLFFYGDTSKCSHFFFSFYHGGVGADASYCARIDQAHSDCARSASKGNICPALCFYVWEVSILFPRPQTKRPPFPVAFSLLPLHFLAGVVRGGPLARMGRAQLYRARSASTGATLRCSVPYVPISQLARYFTCSFVSVSIFIPMPASLSRAISLSITGGTG